MISASAWLWTLEGLPLLVAVASVLPMELEQLRGLTVMSAGCLLLTSLVPAFSTHLGSFALRTSSGAVLLRLDGLSSALLPLAAGLWLLTVAVTPHASFGRKGLRRSALATIVTLTSFLTPSALGLLVLQIAAIWIFLSALQGRQRRIVIGYLGAATILLGAGAVLLLPAGNRSGPAETAALWLIATAVLLRNGIVPFHAWTPEMFDEGRLGPAILFSAPQVGAYIFVTLVFPRASPNLLHIIAFLALVTAVYGAALALVQQSARRACGYLFISQSALVLIGLDSLHPSAIAGGLVVWLSSGLAFAGLARIVLVLESRRGRLQLTKYHGGYERTPVLAVSFLVLGLACTGFPGTLGYVGEELVLHGAVNAYPIMGYAIVAASGMTGVALLRMYFSLFCGQPDTRVHSSLQVELKRRKAVTFAGLVAVLIVFGIAPRLLVESRLRAGVQLLDLRQVGSTTPALMGTGPSAAPR